MFTPRFHAKWFVFAIAILGVAVLPGCRARSNSISSSSTETVSLQRGNITAVVGATGTVRSNQYAIVGWQTSGKVEKVPVKLGQTVQAGDVLASLDPTSLAQNIIQAKVDLINAQNALVDLQKPQPLQVAEAEKALKDAQTTLDDLMNPSALAIAQAETNLKNAQTALDNLMNPDQVAVTQAEQAVLDAQTAVDNAQTGVDRLHYPRGTDTQIKAAQAAYVLAQSEVDRLQKVYQQTHGDPSVDPVKAQALSALETAKSKRDRALANFNWFQEPWSASDIQDKTAALATAQARLADAQNTLDTLKNPTAQDIQLAQAHIADLQDVLNTLKNPTPTDIELAKQRVTDAQDTLDKAKNGPTADDLTIAQTRITVAQATLNQAQLVAPFAGTITQIQVLPDDMVAPGQVAFRIDDLSTLYVELQVSEIDVYQIQIGQPVSVTYDAIPNQEYSGTVSNIGLVGTPIAGVVNFPVTVQLTNVDSAVKTGMTAVANVIISQVNNVLQVPNRAIQTKDGNKFIYVWRASEKSYVSVPVKVGLASDTMTEINSDALNEGDQILVTVPTSLQGAGRIFGGGGGGGQP